VIEDYAASDERMGALLDRLRRSRTYAADVDGKPAVVHSVRPETMAAFLEQMDSRYGGVDSWLADHGFTDEDLRLLRAKLRHP
jgi:protein-tyrosine phosphatase